MIKEKERPSHRPLSYVLLYLPKDALRAYPKVVTLMIYLCHKEAYVCSILLVNLASLLSLQAAGL